MTIKSVKRLVALVMAIAVTSLLLPLELASARGGRGGGNRAGSGMGRGGGNTRGRSNRRDKDKKRDQERGGRELRDALKRVAADDAE